MIRHFASASHALRLTGVAAFLASAAAPAAAQTAVPQVRIDSGTIQGTTSDGVTAFKGIPYAAPPVGGLRWRVPQPVKPWSGVRQATKYGHDCMQKPFGGDAAPLGTEPAEDCLVANVWRPANVPRGRKLPVMVWIYGGGFVNGGSSPAVYSGAQFAKQGVVLVSFNYRVGRFGFFAFPALGSEHPDEVRGNYGLADQIAALKWVQRNAAAFGGDAGNVTVFGESAGGVSINFLMTSPMAKGLFHKAIIESGVGRDRAIGIRRLTADQPGLPSLQTLGTLFARKKGITGTDAAALAGLRALSAAEITDNLSMTSGYAPGEPQTSINYPVLDGKICVEPTEDAYRAGRFAKVPLIAGATSADLGFVPGETVEEVFARFGTAAAAARAAYDPQGTGDLREIKREMGGDAIMIEPARFVVANAAAHGVPAYHYRFSYVATSKAGEWKVGAPHASELPFVFDTVKVKYGSDTSPRDEAMAQALQRYWANFAKTGDPAGAGLPAWPRYDASGDQVMDFQPNGTPAAKPDPWKARLDAIAAMRDQNEAAPATRGK